MQISGAKNNRSDVMGAQESPVSSAGKKGLCGEFMVRFHCSIWFVKTNLAIIKGRRKNVSSLNECDSDISPCIM